MSYTLRLDSKKFLEIQRRGSFSADQMLKAAAVLQNFKMRVLPSGNYQVESLTRPGQFHQVNPRYESCTCEAGKQEKVCYHLAAFMFLRDLQLWDTNQYYAELKRRERDARAMRDMDDARIISRREQLQRLEQRARPRTEWVEELDA